MPEMLLVTVPNVHLCSVGTWECSTGIFRCTPEILAAVVDAQEDPGVRTPIIKLGHTDPRFDGEPSVGRIANLRTSDDGMDLFGDLVGVPAWLAEIMGSAFPDRSVEIWEDYTGATGHEHVAALTALALLGVSVPAIESLDDIRALYEGDDVLIAAAAANTNTDSRHVMLRKVNTMPQPRTTIAQRIAKVFASRKPRKVEAAINVNTIYAEFYENLPSGSWSWIREIWAGDGAFIIVDNDEGDLYRIPWSEDADGDVQFGTPERVMVQYVTAPADDEADDSMIMLARFSPQLLSDTTTETEPPEGVDSMDLKELLAKVGLPADATIEDYDARLVDLAALAAVSPPDDKDKPVTAPEGTVIVDAEQFAALSRNAEAGAAAHQQLANQERDTVIDGAIRAGKFPPARRQHYVDLWKADEVGTRETISALAAGLIPVDASVGHAGSTDLASDEALYAQLYGTDEGGQ